MTRRLGLGLLIVLLLGCGPEDDGAGEDSGAASLTLYSGRNERLIGPLIDRFIEQTGIAVEVRYGGTAELTATILEEGPNSPTDVFISQDAAALGALSRAGRLRRLEPDLLQRVPQRFRSPNDDWIGVSGRARVVVYNPERVREEDLPRSLDQVIDKRYKGRFGVAPGNASFQAHMAMYSAIHGEDEMARLLTGMVRNEPLRYPKNSPIVEAVLAGEIDWGLVNHYYLWRALKESPDAPGRNYYMRAGDGSAFINMAGAGALSDNPAAGTLIRFLVSDSAQRYFAQETFEYPLVAGIEAVAGLPSLSELETSDVDYREVARALERTLVQIQQSGLLGFD